VAARPGSQKPWQTLTPTATTAASIDAAIEILHDSIAKIDRFLAKPATPAAMGAARAFEAEAKKRLEDAH
jgi:hypothetical protein